MLKKIPAVVFLFELALAVVAVPLACSSSSSPGSDGATETAAVDMTSSG